MEGLTFGMKAYIIVLTALIGLCAGSFLNCLAVRTVHGESVAKGRSHCDACGHLLNIRDLVPVLSYLFLKGRCRYCGAKIGTRSLLAEIVSAAVFVSLILRYGISLQALEWLLFAIVLLAVSLADLEGYVIPDQFIIAGVVIRLIFIFLSNDILGQIISSLIGGFAIAIPLLIVVLLAEKMMGREAMGGGDLKLIFLLGLYFGWKLNLLCLFFSCVFGIIFGLTSAKAREKNEDAKVFPFGPAIAAGAWVTVLWGQAMLQWYLTFFKLL